MPITDADVFGDTAQRKVPSQQPLTDADVFGQQEATTSARDVAPASPPAGTSAPLTDQDVFGTQPDNTGYLTAAASRFVQGAAPSVTGILKGFGATQAKEGAYGPSTLEHVMPGGSRALADVAEESAAQPKLPLSQQPLYRAGEAIEKGLTNVLPSTKNLNPTVDELIGGLGSVAGNIGISMVNPLAGAVSAVEQGKAEAADRAIQAGATPEQQVEAANSGLAHIAGATDLADSLIPGIGGKFIRRMIWDAAAEGGQEGLQQLLQNINAMGYKPDQSLWEDVVHSALIGGAVGGIAGGVLGHEHAKEQPEVTPDDIQNAYKNLQPGVVPPSPTAPNVTPMPGAVPTVIPPAVQNFIDNYVAPSPAEAHVRITPSTQQAEEVKPTEQPTQPSAEPGQTIEARAGFNLARLAPMLSTSLYGNESIIPDISIKEMFQNSFDAIKSLITGGQQEDGNINIRMDDQTRTISFTDDGKGMTPEDLAGPFVRVAETGKENEEDTSGGYGIAKMLFLYANQAVSVLTMRDGKVSSMVTTGEQLLNAAQGTGPQPKIEVRKPTDADLRTFPRGHGTVVMVKVPETFRNKATGRTEEIPFKPYDFSHYVLRWSPLFQPINVTFNGRPVQNLGKQFPANEFSPIVKGRYDWGDLQVYAAPATSNRIAWGHVLSNGIWQFNMNVRDAQNNELPYTFYFDVKPKAKPTDPGYPFQPNRRGFREQAEDSIKPLLQWLALVYQKAKFDAEVNDRQDLEYVGPGGQSQGKITFDTIKKRSDNVFDLPKPGEQITVENGKMFIRGKEIPELTPDQMKNFQIDYAELVVDQKTINPNIPILHDGINIARSGPPPIAEQSTVNKLLAWVKAADPEEPLPQQPSEVLSPEGFWTQSMVQFMRDKYGQRFNQYVYDMGNMFIELRDAVAQAMSVGEQIQQGAKTPEAIAEGMNYSSYSDLYTWGVGIGFSEDWRGVSFHVPFRGMFLNIAAPEVRTTLGAAIGFYGTMIHELAHYKVRGHNADFPAEMQRQMIHLETEEINNRLGFGVFNIHDFKQRLANLIAANEDMQQDMYGVMDGSYGHVSPRGKRIEGGGYQQTGNGGVVGGPTGQLSGRELSPGLAANGGGGPSIASAQPRSPNLSAVVSPDSGPADGGLAANQRAIGSGAVPQAAEFQAIRSGLKKLFGGTPPIGVQQAGAHADKINRLYKWTAGLLELMYANPRFTPLLNYVGFVRQMDLEEKRLQEIAQRVLMKWRDLGVRGDRLADFLTDMQNMVYLTPQEKTLGVGRNPSPQEFAALAQKHQLDLDSSKTFSQKSEEDKVYTNMVELITGYHQLLAGKIIQRITSPTSRLSPAAQQKRVNEVQSHMLALRQRPWFPMMHFGQFYIHIKDAQGNLVTADVYETQRQQQRALRRVQSQLKPGETIKADKYPESSFHLIGLPSILLEEMKTMKLDPDQLNDLNSLQEAQKLGLAPTLDPRFQRRYQYPGFAVNVPTNQTSLDMRRSFAKFFFYGSKYYAKLAFRDQLKEQIEFAEALLGTSPKNRVGKIVEYMKDHLRNSVDDIQSDWGVFKGAIFTYAMGGSVAAASANAIQTVGVTAPYLASKFGQVQGPRELTKAMADLTKFYKRGYYVDRNNPLQSFEQRALGYSIQSGRITETMAPWLASLTNGAGLFNVGGTTLQNAWIAFQEKSAMMFETVEQWNRRVAFTAALRLALKNPTARVVQEAINLNQDEFNRLMTNGIGPTGAAMMPVTRDQAAAIITANHVVDKTQFNYASVFRPRIMRGKMGTVLVFKRFVQSLYYLIGQEDRKFKFTYMIYTMFLAGLMGEPFMEDLFALVKAAAWWAPFFGGKYVNLEHEIRRFVNDLTKGSMFENMGDLVLHGFARRGFGLAGLLDLMGGTATGRPGRGLEAPHQDENGNYIGGYQNIPAPVFDRSRAVSPGSISPIDLNILGPEGAEDVNKAIASSAQKASGAAFSLGFNLYKAAFEINQPTWKRLDRIMPRALQSASTALRSAIYGEDTGPSGAPVITYNLRDPEHVMELIGQAMGYQPLRKQAHWDAIMAQSEVEKYYEMSRKSIMLKYFNAVQDGRDSNIEEAAQALERYNESLPDWASGMAINGAQLRASLRSRQRELQQRTVGIPSKRSQRGVASHIQELYPEATINVERPAGE